MKYKGAYGALTVLFLTLILVQPVTVEASDPVSIDLWYSFNDQQIFVTIRHGVINTGTDTCHRYIAGVCETFRVILT